MRSTGTAELLRKLRLHTALPGAFTAIQIRGVRPNTIEPRLIETSRKEHIFSDRRGAVRIEDNRI
jgi:hypothetical protein